MDSLSTFGQAPRQTDTDPAHRFIAPIQISSALSVKEVFLTFGILLYLYAVVKMFTLTFFPFLFHLVDRLEQKIRYHLPLFRQTCQLDILDRSELPRLQHHNERVFIHLDVSRYRGAILQLNILVYEFPDPFQNLFVRQRFQCQSPQSVCSLSFFRFSRLRELISVLWI